MRHEKLTAEELVDFKKYKDREGKRALSPGAPALGVCPEWLAGNCVLGSACPLEHKGEREPGTKAKEKATKAKAKAKAAAT